MLTGLALITALSLAEPDTTVPPSCQLPLEQINHAFDLMHEGKVIRSVIRY